jgi:hypothetical protein
MKAGGAIACLKTRLGYAIACFFQKNAGGCHCLLFVCFKEGWGLPVLACF